MKHLLSILFLLSFGLMAAGQEVADDATQIGQMLQQSFKAQNDTINQLIGATLIESGLADSTEIFPDSLAYDSVQVRPDIQLHSYRLKIERVINDDTTVLTPNGYDYHYLWPSLSPDGTKIAYYVTGRGTFVCDFEGRDPRLVSADLYAPQWYNSNIVMGYSQMLQGRSMAAYSLDGRLQPIGDGTLKQRYKIPRKNQYVDHRLPRPAHPRVYINPGHGSWTKADRPMGTIPYPLNPDTQLPDTCGFYESNTDLWVATELAGQLRDAGYEVMLSRTANGPYPTTGTIADKRYNLPLAVIAAEADSWEPDMFISVHSNAHKDGAMTNYPLILYRGNTGQPSVRTSHEMAEAIWPYLTEAMRNGMEWQSDYRTSPLIRGDLDFYNSSSLGPNGHRGYLGVMKHERPGILVETYFHTYQPARHRALNPDYCAQEGIALARGIKAYFGTRPDRHGHIMGMVKDSTLVMDGYRYYTYAPGTHDAYRPLNGARVILYDDHRKPLAEYYTDQNWNGLFAFYDLKPGRYYLAVRCEGYFDSPSRMNEVVVRANETSFPLVIMKPDRPEPAPEPAPAEGLPSEATQQ